MNMEPRIRVEMEGIKAGVLHHMGQRNDEFNKLVQDELAKVLNENWVALEIQAAVNKTVKNAINGLADNYRLKIAVENALAESLAAMIAKQTTNTES